MSDFCAKLHSCNRCFLAAMQYPVTVGNLFSADSTPSAPSTARFYQGITLLYANPNKEFPENFDPSRPHKTVSLGSVSRVGFVDFLSGRNGLAKVLLLENFREDPIKSKPQSPLDCELRNNATYIVITPTPELYNVTLLAKLEGELPEDFDPEFPGGDVQVEQLLGVSRQGFVRAVDRRNGDFVVALEDYPSRDVSKKDSADIELRDGATYVVLPRKGKNYEQTVDDVAAWQRNHTEAEERHLRNKLVKMLQEENHTNVEPVCLKRVTGPGGKFKEIDAAAIAASCAMVAEYKHVMSIKGVQQLQRLITFIEKYRNQNGVGNVSLFRDKRIIGVLASATEVGGEEQEEMNDLIDRLGYKKICTQGLYGDDPCSTFQASGDSCDISASSDTPGTGPAAPSAMPRRGGRSFLAPMRGRAMLVRPRLVNNGVVSFRPYF
ncbi:hypothetical protein NADE_006263 [Nannochloris sp. 'desiccata']|nr:hypothetical protein KSW81_008159 [Chlorella desiccata (nom. nud.)]KAH7619421.1 hypothetical protein NADE_006263 [Chlorella desiccata (nom. nud.)]